MRHFLIIIFISVGLLSCESQKSPFNAPVEIEGGFISGNRDSSTGVYSFKGIPFAQPPVGDLRWKSPKPVEPWDGIKPCAKFGPSPVQREPSPFMFWSSEFLIPPKMISEDCLYLNVWTKAKSKDAKLPVLVYIYGGGYNSGGSACPIYDGTSTAEKDVIFVSFNYRVGVFGFLAHPELSEESEFNSSGNYGLLDMIAALQWVKNNIAAFGGDPDNVTIAGQSAGASAVNHLVASPYGHNLFNKAVAQSGGNVISNPNRPQMGLKRAEEIGIAFADSLGATGIEDLRNMSASQIHNARGGIRTPIVDGSIIPESIAKIFDQGRQNDVPTIVGWNKDDVVMMAPRPADDFRNDMANNFGEMAPAFFEAYPSSTEEEAAQAQFDFNRDIIFGSQDYFWALKQTRNGKSPIYVYNFNRDVPAYDDSTAFGAFHSGEIVYLYDNLHTLDRPWQEIDHQITQQFSSYMINFVKSGDPNGEGLPQWYPFDPQKNKAMIIDSVTSFEEIPTLDKMKFWERYFSFQEAI